MIFKNPFINWSHSRSLAPLNCIVVSRAGSAPWVEILHHAESCPALRGIESIPSGRILLFDPVFLIGDEEVVSFAFIAQAVSKNCKDFASRSIQGWDDVTFTALMRPRYCGMQTMAQITEGQFGSKVLHGVELILPTNQRPPPA